MTKTNESERARNRRTEENRVRAAIAQRYAGRGSLGGGMGPLVATIVARNAGREFLIRRIDLIDLLRAGHWPKPITAAVRLWMVHGPNQVLRQSEGDAFETFYETAYALIKASIIAPPPELLDGTLLPEDITSEQCKPLFVGENEKPDDDQLQLVSWERYTELHDEIAALRQRIRSGKYAESTVRKDEKALHELEAGLSSVTCLHWEDAVVIASEVMNHAGGAHRRFRPVEADVLGRLAHTEGDGADDEPDAEAVA